MKTSALIPVVAYLGVAGFASAAPIQAAETETHLDKRTFCFWGFGWGCNTNTPTTTSSAPAKTSTASSVVSSAAAVKSSAVTSSSAVKSSAAVVVSSAAKASSVAPVASSTTSAKAGSTASSATKVASASWAQCTDFDWSAWNEKEWTWGGGYTKQYVQDWYIAEYGLAPPPGMNWRQVSSLVSKFGAKTVAVPAKTASKYTGKGCNNPWTSAAPATKTKAVTTTAKPASTTSVKPAVTSQAAQSSVVVAKPSSAAASSVSPSPSKAAASSAAVSPSKAASSAVVSASGAAPSVASPAASSASSVAVPPVVVGNGNGSASSAAAGTAAPVASSAAAGASSPVASSAAAGAASPVASSAAAGAASPIASSAAAASPSPAAPSSTGSDGASTGTPGTGTGAAGTGSGSPGTGSGVPGTGSGTPGTGEGSNNGTSTAIPIPEPTVPAAVTINGFTYGGCAQEVAGRLLEKVQTSSASQTIESCTALCASYGFGVAGLEYGNECYCGTLDDVEDAELSGECYMPCSGNDKQICGGPNAINWYYDPDLVPPTVELPAGWTTYGVVNEGTQGQRLLSTLLYASNDNTVEKCAQGCAAAGYKVAGTEYSSECFCGNGFTQAAGGGELVDDSAAFMACSGNLAQKCGGPSILSVTSAFGDNIPFI